MKAFRGSLNKTFRALLSGILTISLFPISGASAGDGTITKNWSVQFTTDTYFHPELSVPPTDDNYGAYFVLPPCLGKIINDCITSFEALEKNGKWISGTFKEYLPLKNLVWEDNKFESYYGNVSDIAFLKEDLPRNLPAGGRTGIWEIQGVKHSLGTDFAINISFPGASTNTTNPRDPGSTITWSNSTGGIYANLYPIDYSGSGTGCNGAFGKASFACPNVQNGEFPEFSKFRITVNFQKTKAVLNNSSWLAGRLSNSKISEAILSDGSKLLTVEGSPIKIGSVMTEFEKTEANYQILKSALNKYNEIAWGNINDSSISYESFLQASGSGFSTVSPGTLEAWRILEEKFKFTYFSEQGAWSVQSVVVSPSDSGLLKKCNSDNLNPGIISTNAIAANPRPPVWDPISQELIYTVASTHTRKNGSLNVGVYELSIDERLALCLWGTSALSYRASIKVESPDGLSKVTTSTFVKRDGYLTFRAAGFGYSTSVIKIQLGSQSTDLKSQEVMPDYFPDSVILNENATSVPSINVTPTPTTTPNVPSVSVTPAPTTPTTTKVLGVKKTTITCIKGKVTKKVTAIKPKCPTGYKKK